MAITKPNIKYIRKNPRKVIKNLESYLEIARNAAKKLEQSQITYDEKDNLIIYFALVNYIKELENDIKEIKYNTILKQYKTDQEETWHYIGETLKQIEE